MSHVKIIPDGRGHDVLFPWWLKGLIGAIFTGVVGSCVAAGGGAIIAWRQIAINADAIADVQKIQEQQTAILTDMHNQFLTRSEWSQAHNDLETQVRLGDGVLQHEIDQLLSGQYRTHELLEKLPASGSAK